MALFTYRVEHSKMNKKINANTLLLQHLHNAVKSYPNILIIDLSTENKNKYYSSKNTIKKVFGRMSFD